MRPLSPPMISVGDVLRHQGRLRQLELQVTRKLDGLLQGDYLGLVPGGGTEPAEARAYAPGDDVRRMDWNLTARTNQPHIRTTIADRELETWLVVDHSASLDFGTADCEKRDLALAAAATFSFLAARNGNRLAASLFGSGGSEMVPPRGGRAAALALLHKIAEKPRTLTVAQGSSSLAEALRKVRHTARRRGLIVLISDLLDDSSWTQELRALSLRHQIVVVDVRDPRESELPAVGLLTFIDPETGDRLEVHTSDAKVRARFAAAAAEQTDRKARAIRSTGAAHLILSTDRDWLGDVVRFVAARRLHR